MLKMIDYTPNQIIAHNDLIIMSYALPISLSTEGYRETSLEALT